MKSHENTFSAGRRPPSRMRGAAGAAARRGPVVFRLLIAAGLLTALALPMTALGANASASTRGIRQWQQAIEQLKMPGKGCFDASYPKIQWRQATCSRPPKTPFEPAPPPAGSPPPEQVGGGGATDYAAEVSGLMTSATGYFRNESAGVTESSVTGPNEYSLQLNTQTFNSPPCGLSLTCQGWEQFVYDTSTNSVFIQDWLIEYDTTPCPSGWTEWPLYGHIYCDINSPGAGDLTVAAPKAGQLASDMVTLTGSATAGAGGTDTVVMTDGGKAVGNNTQSDSVVDLADHWDVAEFNVFGDGSGDEANFSSGADLGVGLTVHNGTKAAPTCLNVSYTGETNSLNLSGAPALGAGPSPSIAFDENSSPGVPACAAAVGWGEIHLNTFRNLAYNFQASGDFDLATANPAVTSGPPLSVQARLVSFGPHPNLSVSHAVAAQIGRSQVAVCLGRQMLLKIDRKPVPLASGHWRAVPGGGTVLRQGNVLTIRDAAGDSVQVTADSYLGFPYLDVRVGLVRWPTNVSGLLANAGSNANAIESAGGTVLTAPFAFSTFYRLYGNSWRLPASQDLLTACGTKFASGTPTGNFEVSNLAPKAQRTARGICVRAGVRAPALLDACTLDVAVLGKEATRVYATLPAHVIWGKILSPGAGAPSVRS